ncbi:nitrate reductase [Enterobacter roggenkampii]|uniref:nitrate reductase n=1 Tax=Enterobacter roggenkampii TaxID=1812935 RepID=UPI0020064B47|nr:nitrate reductase [Enterobacter roggenkampii]MCK6887814.1 molybdopterin-dependent oxidoreductase [Enterobacter roggenkampii]MDH0515310.1 molybdopterin-dependent oxidoreductase [Enterobacter roggenkampii]HBM0959609.1 molybdopterin-dependent oxidoreductase [Enterobacter roggenkampii]HDS9609588.1 molybdopterin-dependent oxidoreductase [Enterobacter roggenkampii]
MTETRTTCPYCGVGCGVVARVDGETVSVRGDETHPANFGRLCVKGSALGETMGLQGRLLRPVVDGAEVAWAQALGAAGERLQDIIDKWGPQAVAFYASGQLLTEDYYAANKLMKGFIGAANIDTNSRLCMSSAVVGYKRAFGEDVVPCSYEDVENSDLVVLVGSNAAWTHPVLYQRLVQAKHNNPQMKVVVIDPRRTASCDIADLHLALTPGSDAGLFVGLLNVIQGTDAWPISRVAAFCGVSPQDIGTFYDWFMTAPRAITLYTMGINQSSSGSDKCSAIINVHLASGKFNRPGCGPFSLTGQPNAMGGREVGGLANQLAAHMNFEPDDLSRVARFWGTERLAQTPGLMAVELFDAIARGEVKAVWIMGTNPAVSLPDSHAVCQALGRCPLVIVSEVMNDTDTSRFAHIRFPALAWGEKDGTVTNSERRISRQRAFLPAPGEAKPDWWIVAQVAKRLGHGDAFAWLHPHQIFCEHAALTAFENDGARALNLHDLATLTREEWERLEPWQWPRGDFPCRNIVPVDPQSHGATVSALYPLILNSGRIRDQWHTMTRTGYVARLMQHIAEPFVEVCPADAIRFSLCDGQLARISSPRGVMVARVRISDAQREGNAFAPMHWNAEFARQGKVNALVEGRCDPVSGQPESKQTAVRIQPWQPVWQGELYAREGLEMPSSVYWWRKASRLTVACDKPLLSWVMEHASGRGWQLQVAQTGERSSVLAWHEGQLMLGFWEGTALPALAHTVIEAAFHSPPVLPAARHALLNGQSVGKAMDPGRIICSCFSVGEEAIREAIAGGCDSVTALGAKLRCGTNCGSCVPELKGLFQDNPEMSARTAFQGLSR